jgi:FKBP-type peptidyl-prolyl cis-trans isomerase FkpA
MRHQPWFLALLVCGLAVGCSQPEKPADSSTSESSTSAASGDAAKPESGPESIDGKAVAGPPKPPETPKGPGPSRGPEVAEMGPKTVKTKSGLQYEDLIVGTGSEAKNGKTVSVHYTGWLTDGTKFDSSLDRGEPFQITLPGQVIPGWNEGIPGMKVGGKRKLLIPPALGYGASENGPIPANSTLVFEVELLQVD